MSHVDITAKTKEEAISSGLAQLGVSVSDVKIEVLEEGTKGFFGIGSKPCVVRLTTNEADTSLKDVLGNLSLSDAITSNEKKVGKQQEEKAPRTEEAPQAARKPHTVKPQKEAPAAEDSNKTEKPAQAEESAHSAAPFDKAVEEKTREFLSELTRLMGVEVSIDISRDEEGNVLVSMFGDTLGILIGRRGETLDAIQYLTSLYVNRGQEGYTRVTLDTENYRVKREEALRRLANRMANRAIKTGRKVVMEPMNPYERRILHSALQQNEAVTTHSEGEEPNRHVVITLKQPNK